MKFFSKENFEDCKLCMGALFLIFSSLGPVISVMLAVMVTNNLIIKIIPLISLFISVLIVGTLYLSYKMQQYSIEN